jgi:hypothetical protein
VLLDLMSDKDVEYNINRLQSEVEAKQKHVDALKAWMASRRASA